MIKVLLFGVFDLFHFGHLRLLKSASRLGDYLIVAVQANEEAIRSKSDDSLGPLYDVEERMEMIRALRCVDVVMPYRNVGDDIKKIEFSIFVKGPDQVHSGFISATKWCEENGKKVVVLPRTEGISTSYIKRMVIDLQDKTRQVGKLN